MLRYAISDGQFALERQRTHPGASRARLLAQSKALAEQSTDFFLIREPALPAAELASLTREILAILIGTPTRLLLHSRADIAAATHAHGVHLPARPRNLTPDQVRAVYSATGVPQPVVSLSCHTPEDAARARSLRPDLVLFGPVFGKTVAGELITPPTGLPALHQACTDAGLIPILALGGITHTNTSACLHAGAAGIAAIRLFGHTGR